METQVDCQEKSIVKKFKDEVDVEEFKRKLIVQLMHSTAGNNALDYHLADLAASIWLDHFDKSPEELEEFIRSTPIEPLGAQDEGFFSVVDTSKEDTHKGSYKDALLSNLPEEEEDE